MNPRPFDYASEGQYATYQTDLTNVALPYPSSREHQATTWPSYSSTAPYAPFPPSLPAASSSRGQASSTSSLAAIFGGCPYPYHATEFANNAIFASTILRQPHQTPHIVEAPLATIAPELTLATPSTDAPTYPTPSLPQQDETPAPRPAKRRREETEENGKGYKASNGKKRRVASAKSRSHSPLMDIEPQSSQHAAPLRVGRAAQNRQPKKPKKRGARPSSPGIENMPILNDRQESYEYVEGGHAGTRSRSRAMALARPSGILDAAPCADVPSCDQPVGAGAAAGEHTWCTPAFYDELCEIASALVAQSQLAPSTSGASVEVAQDGSCINEAPPEAISPSPEAPRRRAPTKRTRAGSRKARNKGNLAEGSSGEKFLCPLADSNGVCHSKAGLDGGSSEAPRKIKASAYWDGAIQKPRPPKLSAFGRAADLERHILSVHLNAHVRCRRCDDAGKLTQFARYDGFLRHLRGTCFGEEDFDIGREASRQFAFISMPCYRDPGGLFVKALSALRKTRTALSLENSLREKYAKDVRRCDCCKNLNDEEMDAIKPPHLAMGDSYVQCTPNRAFEVSDEARLPPEAEEGVEEEPVAEPGEATDLDVESVSSAASCQREMFLTAQETSAPGVPNFPGVDERESQEAPVQAVVMPADYNSTVQVAGPRNASHEPAALILDQLPELFQPWEMDFGLEVDPDALVSDTTWTQWMSPNSS